MLSRIALPLSVVYVHRKDGTVDALPGVNGLYFFPRKNDDGCSHQPIFQVDHLINMDVVLQVLKYSSVEQLLFSRI